MALVSPRENTDRRVSPRAPIDWYDEGEHRRKIAEVLNLIVALVDDIRAFVRDHVSVAIYGAMRTSTVSGTYNLGAGWTKYTDFDQQNVTPKGTTFDTATDTFQINANGIYMFYLGFTFDHNESNQGRSFQFRLFNEADSTALGSPVDIGVGRNTPVTNFAFQFMFEIADANEDDAIRIELGNGSSINGTFSEFEVGVYSIGELQGVDEIGNPAA